MKTPQGLTVCVSLRLPITSLTEFSLPFNRQKLGFGLGLFYTKVRVQRRVPSKQQQCTISGVCVCVCVGGGSHLQKLLQHPPWQPEPALLFGCLATCGSSSGCKRSTTRYFAYTSRHPLLKVYAPVCRVEPTSPPIHLGFCKSSTTPSLSFFQHSQFSSILQIQATQFVFSLNIRKGSLVPKRMGGGLISE